MLGTQERICLVSNAKNGLSLALRVQNQRPFIRSRLHQIGISNSPEVRLALHQTKGWEIQDLLGPLVGAEARRIEQMVLATLWRREIKTGLQAGLRKFDGYTESWKSQLFSPESVEAIIGFRPKARD